MTHHPKIFLKSVTRFEGIFILNLYGNLLFLGGGFCILLGFITATFPQNLSTILMILSAAPAILFFWGGLRVTSRLPAKIRIANLLFKRIARHGFKKDIFENLCGDICMRLLVRYVLTKTGHSACYKEILITYRERGTFFVEHSSPQLEKLLNSGALSHDDIREAIRGYLSR